MASRGGQLPPLAASPAVISEQLQPHPPTPLLRLLLLLSSHKMMELKLLL